MIAAVHVVTHSSFWPATLGAWAAVFGGVAAGGAALLGLRNRQKIQEVHVLVNSQRTQMQGALDTMTANRDRLIADREEAHDPAAVQDVNIVGVPKVT